MMVQELRSVRDIYADLDGGQSDETITGVPTQRDTCRRGGEGVGTAARRAHRKVPAFGSVIYGFAEHDQRYPHPAYHTRDVIRPENVRRLITFPDSQ
jgi:hypothetical protein